MPTDPVDCDVVDIDAGKASYGTAACVACHGAFDESTGMAPGGGSFPALNVNAFTALAGSTLDIYIAEKMMNFPAGCAGDAACEAEAANIATYLKKYSNTPWCESVASSSSMSSEMSSVSSMSSEMSSSSAGALDATVKYVFPTQGAHLGGATSVKVILEVTETSMAGTVTAVRVNSALDLEKDGNLWKSMNNLTVDSSTNGQEFDVQVQLDGADWYDANSLMINNVGGETLTKAGSTAVGYARSIAINAAGTVFYSDVVAAKVYKVNPITGESEAIYEGTPAKNAVDKINWPLTVDGDTVYLIADSFEYSADLNDKAYKLQVIAIDTAAGNTTVVFEDENDAADRIKSVKGLLLDTDGSFGKSEDAKALYSIDHLNDTIVTWWLEGDEFGYPVIDDYGTTSGKSGLSAMARSPKNDNIFVIREFNETNRRGVPTLIELVSKRKGATANDRKNLDDISQPTAMAFDATGDNLYIASVSQIFKMNMADYTYTVVSSSRGDKPKVGSGVSLSASIKAMSIHPDSGMLYIAGDGDGIIMVDLATGDRYGVAK